jgi:riboflavin biosynthesis pyrimidine reductase
VVSDFGEFAARKVRDAESAVLIPFTTADDRSSGIDSVAIGNEWTRELYDGPFHLAVDRAGDGSAPTAGASRPTAAAPLVSLVFVQSREGNTGAANPEELGGGPADKHVIYEGLSRVGVDAVLAGARTAEGAEVFFSVWHPQLVALRATLGLPRHPAQVVVTGSGCVDVDGTLLFNVPDVPVFILATPNACSRLERAAARRPWIELVPIQPGEVRPGLEYLRRARGIRRISAIGGRTTASALIDAGLVQDLLLTTTARSGGEPGTPFYVGRTPPRLDLIVRKRCADPAYPTVFNHLSLITDP